MLNQGYDLIGDIHGHAEPLRHLLEKLGYREVAGLFQHDTRKVIFVGDFVDRGPKQREVLRIARTMCESDMALAVLGNHEFNAIGFATSDGKGSQLRPDTKANRHQHAEFLRQLDEGSQEYNDAIIWFRELPVWLEFPDFRVIHACWHEHSRSVLRPHLDSRNCFTKEGFLEANKRESPAYVAAEILLKGPEEPLPREMSFPDESGIKRHNVRTRWWDAKATTFREAAQGWNDENGELPNDKLPRDFRYLEPVPVLFGHYWMNGEPTITAPNAACLDFGIASKDKDGYLTAYRWSGERELLSGNLVHVSAKGR